MSDTDYMKRKLNSIGKRCFEECFDIFDSYSRGVISTSDAINEVMSIMECSASGAEIRVGNARLIFRAGMEKAALELAKNRRK